MTPSVLSKFQNPGSPDRPPMMDGWVVRITFGWSVYAVVRNEDETLISLLCCLLSTITRAYIPRHIVKSRRHEMSIQSSPIVLKFCMRLCTSDAKRPVNFQGHCSIFPNYTQLSKGKKSVGNSLVAKRTRKIRTPPFWDTPRHLKLNLT